MKQNRCFYKLCYVLSRIYFAIFYRIEIKGRENIRKGAAMICANHSSSYDPFFLAFAFGINNRIHIVAKAELFRNPVLAWILKKLGMISVDREISDVSTIKKTLGYLKADEKVAIFPEGTRVAQDDAITAKSGAVKLAERARVPIVPVFIPRQKRMFTKVTVIIGKPYLIDKAESKRTQECYTELAGELMEKIKKLCS